MRRKPDDKISVAHAVTDVTGAILTLTATIFLGERYDHLGLHDCMKELICIGLVVMCIWLYEAWKFWRRRSNVVYKNYNDPDPLRIPRPRLLESVGGIVFAACMIAVLFYFIDQYSMIRYYDRLKKLYREYYPEYVGEPVDITPNQALLKDWEKHISIYPVGDQGGTIYDYERLDWANDLSYLNFRSVYDAEWEGTRAMERYCYTLKRNGWEEQGRLFFTKEINGEQCIADLSEWDKRGKQQVCIDYYPESFLPGVKR